MSLWQYNKIKLWLDKIGEKNLNAPQNDGPHAPQNRGQVGFYRGISIIYTNFPLFTQN